MAVGKAVYKLGDVLLEAKPLCHVISLKNNGNYCDNCGKCPSEDQRLLRCSNCKYESYCSRSCQKAAWKYHQFECPLLKAKAPKIPADSARLFMKLIWCYAHERLVGESNSRSFNDICAHVELMSTDPNRCKQFADLLYTVTKYAGEEKLNALVNQNAVLFEIFGKMAFNTFTLTYMNDPIGIAIYLEASKFNHSCYPNAVAVYDGINIRISTICDVNTGNEPILINYIDPFDITSNRKNELKDNYYFSCKCKKCSDDERCETENSWVCPGCLRDYPLSESLLPCLHCGKTDITDEYVTECRSLQVKAEELINGKIYSDTTDKMISFLNNNKFLSDSNIRVQLLRAFIYDSGVNSSDSKSMLEMGRNLEQIYPLHYPPYFPMIGIHLFKQGRHAWNMNNYISAADYLVKARRILLPTHGQSHPLIKIIEREVGECKLAQHIAASPDVMPTPPELMHHS